MTCLFFCYSVICHPSRSLSRSACCLARNLRSVSFVHLPCVQLLCPAVALAADQLLVGALAPLNLSRSCFHLWSTCDAIAPSSKKKKRRRDHVLKRGEEMRWLGTFSKNIDHVLKRGQAMMWLGPFSKNIVHVLKRGQAMMWLGPCSKNIDHVSKRGEEMMWLGPCSKNTDHVLKRREEMMWLGPWSKSIDHVLKRREEMMWLGPWSKSIDHVLKRGEEMMWLAPFSKNMDHVVKRGEEMMWLGPCSRNIDHVLEDRIGPSAPSQTLCSQPLVNSSRYDNQLLTFVDRNDDGRPGNGRWKSRDWSSSTGTRSTSATELGFVPEEGGHQRIAKITCARERSTCSLWVKGLECWSCGARLLRSFAL